MVKPKIIKDLENIKLDIGDKNLLETLNKEDLVKSINEVFNDKNSKLVSPSSNLDFVSSSGFYRTNVEIDSFMPTQDDYSVCVILSEDSNGEIARYMYAIAKMTGELYSRTISSDGETFGWKLSSYNEEHFGKIASTSNLGHIKPDGTTLVVDNNGIASVVNNFGNASGTNDLVITLSPIPTLVAGMIVRFKNTTANTGNVTLNINSLGAKPVLINGGVQLSNGYLKADGIYTVCYDGSNFILQGDGSGSKDITQLINSINNIFDT